VESLSPTDRICPRLPKKWPLKKNSYPGGQRGTVIANYCAEVGGEKVLAIILTLSGWQRRPFQPLGIVIKRKA
jgi:hypothetical protein